MSEINQNVKDSRQQYYQHISGQNLTPLWESLHHLVPQTPNANCAPAYWNYQEIRPLLMESGNVIGAKEAIRRVLVLENPALRGPVVDHGDLIRWFTADPARRSRAESSP
ncbi:gentisate 1,2-dioxygenase [Salmonella enterica subsp. enterica]|nr:gentisate 1,2-dioxygenase [Salmonella enterica subsp. enterica]